MPIHLSIFCGCFCATMEESSSCYRDHVPPMKPKISLNLVLYRKSLQSLVLDSKIYWHFRLVSAILEI